MIDALLKEIDLRKDYLANKTIETIYFGGGTPSLLTADELNRFFDTIRRVYSIHPNAEITMEANPDDLSLEYLKRLRSTPINRLSIGIQSFRDPDLSWMNRTHNSMEATASVTNAALAGFENISIDLILLYCCVQVYWA